MDKQSEAQRRKELKQRVKRQERELLESQMPLSREVLQALFDHLDTTLGQGCDQSLQLTREFLRQQCVDEQSVLPWLVEQGGGCDCEVLANVEEKCG